MQSTCFVSWFGPQAVASGRSEANRRDERDRVRRESAKRKLATASPVIARKRCWTALTHSSQWRNNITPIHSIGGLPILHSRYVSHTSHQIAPSTEARSAGLVQNTDTQTVSCRYAAETPERHAKGPHQTRSKRATTAFASIITDRKHSPNSPPPSPPG